MDYSAYVVPLLLAFVWREQGQREDGEEDSERVENDHEVVHPDRLHGNADERENGEKAQKYRASDDNRVEVFVESRLGHHFQARGGILGPRLVEKRPHQRVERHERAPHKEEVEMRRSLLHNWVTVF